MRRCIHNRPKILHVISSLNRGGTETNLVHSLNLFHLELFEHIVCCTSRGGPLEVEIRKEIPVYVLKKNRDGFEISVLWHLLRLVKAKRVNLMISYLPTADIYSFLARIFCPRLPLVTTKVNASFAHEDMLTFGRMGNKNSTIFKVLAKLAFSMERIAAHSAVGVVINSRSLEGFFNDHYHVRSSNIYYLPWGLRLERFRPTRGKGKTKVEAGFGNKFVIGNVSRLEEHKGHIFLIEAFSRIHKEFPQTHLLIVGDGSKRKALEEKAARLNVQMNVTFTGELPWNDVINSYNLMDVFILPSFYEGLPTVVLEAMAMRLPVICTDVWGAENILLTVPAGSGDAIYSKLKWLLLNPQVYERMGEMGRKCVEENFEIAGRVVQKEGFYYSLLHENRKVIIE